MSLDQRTIRLQQAITEVINRQLATDDPPEMRLTLERLMAEGRSENEARTLIGHVVVEEVLRVVAAGQPFDDARYRERLKALVREP